jgi:two-component system LytT family response regulator
MRALIVDDEALARAFLAEQLAAIPDIAIVGAAANGFEAVKLVDELRPDVVLLDIQMPKLSGFEVLELLGDRAPAVIFVTAFDEFALKAFQVHAIDYLLKPVAPERLAAAIARVGERLLAKSHPPLARELFAAARPPGRPLERVVVRDEGQVHVLTVDRIDFIEARDDYVEFSAGGKRRRKQQTLAELEAQLDATRFVRIHRSFLLNIDRLKRLELYAKDSWQAILEDGTRLPVSRSGHARLKSVIGG